MMKIVGGFLFKMQSVLCLQFLSNKNVWRAKDAVVLRHTEVFQYIIRATISLLLTNGSALKSII